MNSDGHGDPLAELPKAARRIYERELAQLVADADPDFDAKDRHDLALMAVKRAGYFFTPEGWLKEGTKRAQGYPEGRGIKIDPETGEAKLA